MADWGTPPGLVDNEPRSDSPSNDMRTAQLERQRRLREQAEKKKRRHQLGKIERNEVSSARKRDGKTPLVTTSMDVTEGVGRYAYDNPEAYNDSASEPFDNTTSVKVVNVAPPDTIGDSDSSLSEKDIPKSLTAPSKSQSESSIQSARQSSPSPTPVAKQPAERQKKSKKRDKSKRQEAEPVKHHIDEQPQAFGSDEEDGIETVQPDPHTQVGLNKRVVCIKVAYFMLTIMRNQIGGII